jgi:hypothetical protein
MQRIFCKTIRHTVPVRPGGAGAIDTGGGPRGGQNRL